MAVGQFIKDFYFTGSVTLTSQAWHHNLREGDLREVLSLFRVMGKPAQSS